MALSLHRDERGGAAVEYLIGIGLVALLAAVGYERFGGSVDAKVRCMSAEVVGGGSCAPGGDALERGGDSARSAAADESDVPMVLAAAHRPLYAPARAPANHVDDLEFIRDKLEGNWFGNVSTGALRDINERLATMSPQERRDVIAELSDDELRKWLDEVGGAWGGLPGEEKRELYGSIAEMPDGHQLARFARVVFDKVPESEHEFIESMAAHASPDTKLQLIQAFNDGIDPNASEFSTYPRMLVERKGNPPTRTVIAALESLAGEPPSLTEAGESAFDRAVVQLDEAGKLDDVLLAGAGEVRTTTSTGTDGPPMMITTSTFHPEPLIDVLDGAARSSDDDVKRRVLIGAAPALHKVEFTDELLQKAGIVPRAETPRIAAAMYRVLDLPPPKPEWSPPAKDPPAGDFSSDVNTMMQRLRDNKARVFEAAEYYDIDPRAIPLVAYVEAQHGDSIFRRAGLGRGEGYGAMHESAAFAQHPDWTLEQANAARNSSTYAPALIAADMDAKARAFELITGGAFDIRSDPVALAWAYNNSMATVIDRAKELDDARRAGKPMDPKFTEDMGLGQLGMAGHAKQELEAGRVDDFRAP